LSLHSRYPLRDSDCASAWGCAATGRSRLRPTPRRGPACRFRRTLPGSWPAQGGLAPPAGTPRGRALTPAARCSSAARIRQSPASAHRFPPGHPDACGCCTRTASGRGRGHQPQQATSHSRFRHLPSTILRPIAIRLLVFTAFSLNMPISISFLSSDIK